MNGFKVVGDKKRCLHELASKVALQVVFESPVWSGPVIGSPWALTETKTG